MILNRHAFGVWSFVATRAFKPVFKRPDFSAAEAIRKTLKERKIAIYIHIPFCKGICLYCPYVRYPICKGEIISRYVKALEAEIRTYGAIFRDLDLKVVDVHAGGGTPSLLSGKQFKKILDALIEHFEVQPKIAIEANPEDLADGGHASDLVDNGVGEVSLGVQSFNDQVLKRLGRRHDVKDSIRSIENLHKAGVEYINIDMMYMVPDQSLDEWNADLEMAAEQDVDEITCYPTLITEYCPGHKLVKMKKVNQPSKRTFRKMVYAAEDVLSSKGFVPAEIYGYSKKAHWKYVTVNYEMEGPLLGLGCGAMGFTGGYEYQNTCSVPEYIKATLSGKLPIAGGRFVELKERAIRYATCRLFVCRKLDLADFKSKFGDFKDLVGKSGFGRTLKLLQMLRRVRRHGGKIELTRSGIFTAYRVCWAFVLNVPCRLCEEFQKIPWPSEVTIS